MDAVILAAGRGSRLKGVAPPYHKPLMVVDGKPLLLQALDLVHGSRWVASTVIVAAPENVQAIAALLDDCEYPEHKVRLVVQRSSLGPGEAFIAGFEATAQRDECIVLMGDNTFPGGRDELNTLLNAWSKKSGAGRDRAAVGVGCSIAREWEEAKRFTRVTQDLRFRENDEVDEGPWDDGYYRVWCGPLVVPGQKLSDYLTTVREAEGVPELKLGRYLGHIASSHDVIVADSTSEDIGTKEALT